MGWPQPAVPAINRLPAARWVGAACGVTIAHGWSASPQAKQPCARPSWRARARLWSGERWAHPREALGGGALRRPPCGPTRTGGPSREHPPGPTRASRVGLPRRCGCQSRASAAHREKAGTLMMHGACARWAGARAAERGRGNATLAAPERRRLGGAGWRCVCTDDKDEPAPVDAKGGRVERFTDCVVCSTKRLEQKDGHQDATRSGWNAPSPSALCRAFGHLVVDRTPERPQGAWGPSASPPPCVDRSESRQKP